MSYIRKKPRVNGLKKGGVTIKQVAEEFIHAKDIYQGPTMYFKRCLQNNKSQTTSLAQTSSNSYI